MGGGRGRGTGDGDGGDKGVLVRGFYVDRVAVCEKLC